ncbi:MAG TPA: NAD(P)-dependent oxidoreductase [Pseudomonadota bacterium]|nr:NAD(P)-dependent oxidoreductase [Pseudomonadota bacterium]
MARKDTGDIAAGRLDAAGYAKNFADVAPPLDRQRALIEASRCHFCYDAPCIQACPTSIDIPGFIRAISTDNLRGAATKILDANIFGGQCARVCPTEILCEGECVRNDPEDKPVEIGALQRYATDWVFEQGARLFSRAASTGKRVAVVGAGPAGLACAHALAMRGHDVDVFEARAKSGGLNEYGIAAYKVVDFSQREVDWLLSIGGIAVHHGKALGRDIQLSQLRREYDAVFLGLGLTGVNALGLGDEALPGVRNAVDFISELRQAANKAGVAVGRRVVVIGGGNTAIDAAVQSKRLGAERVTLVYRRGAEAMSATDHEQGFAQSEGVHVVHYAQPTELLQRAGVLCGVRFEHTRIEGGKLIGSGEYFEVEADVVLKAIGQVMLTDGLSEGGVDLLRLNKGRIAVDADFATSLAGVYAGGDCVGGKTDLTVQSVADGKHAAAAIHAYLNADREVQHG